MKADQFKQVENLMRRINLLENRYQEQQVVIANQQAVIANKVKFDRDYRAPGEESSL